MSTTTADRTHPSHRQGDLDDQPSLRTATRSGTFDEATVRAIAAKRAQAGTDLIVTRARLRNKIFNILTPEQQNRPKYLGPLFEGRWGRFEGLR